MTTPTAFLAFDFSINGSSIVAKITIVDPADAAELEADNRHAILVAQLLAARAAYNDAKFNGSSEEAGRALTALGVARDAYADFDA
jgi:hypothetical protein